MTLQAAVDLFEVLADKYASPSILDDETLSLLNMGMNEYLNRLFPDNQGGVVNYEMDSNTLANLQPLIYTLTGISMTSGGVVTTSTINTALVAASSAGATYFRIGSIGLTASGVTYPVKFVKQNNRWSFERNVFKKPSVTNPKFTLISTGLQFFPVSTTSSLTINVIKKPKLFASADLASEVELSDYVMYSIIAHALKLAGIATRDESLIEDIRTSAIQNVQ